MNKVFLSVKEGLKNLVDCSPSLVSDKWLPVLVRQKALLANVSCILALFTFYPPSLITSTHLSNQCMQQLASLVLLSESSTDCYPSNWLGRLHQIKHIKERTETASTLSNTGGSTERRLSSPTASLNGQGIPDFTLYC